MVKYTWYREVIQVHFDMHACKVKYKLMTHLKLTFGNLTAFSKLTVLLPILALENGQQQDISSGVPVPSLLPAAVTQEPRTGKFQRKHKITMYFTK